MGLKVKRSIALLLTAVLVLSSLSGCGATTSSKSSGESTSGTAVSAGNSESGLAESNGLYSKVVVAVSADMEDLTPCKVNGVTRSNVFWSIYESLFDFDEDLNLVPSLATGYTIVSDTEWDIEIYKKIYDSDGNHITADDVVHAVEWLVESGNNIRYNIFASIEKIDDYTVRYHWKEAPTSTSDLEWPLTRTFIFSQTAWESHNFAVDPVGTANFTVESFVTGSSLTLKANYDYWAQNTDEDVSMRCRFHDTTVDTIVYNTIAEPFSAVVALEMGTVDFCDYVPLNSLAEFAEGGTHSERYNVESTLGTEYYYFLPNMADGVSGIVGKDLDLRLAIYYALDNEVVAKAMSGNNVVLKTLGCSSYPDHEASWDDDPNYINTYDVAAAKKYLEASNYNGEEIVIIGLANEECKNAMMMIQSLLVDSLGLNVSLQTYEKSFLLTVMAERTGWDFCVANTGGSILVDSWNRVISQEGNDGWTYGWLKDDKLQQLYDTARAGGTHDAEHMKAVIDYAFSIGCIYALSVRSSSIVYSKDITDVCYREGYWVIGASKFNTNK